jgi:hypothetical protein
MTDQQHDGDQFFSRCKAGKRWFWAVLSWESAPCPLDHGYAATVAEAESHRPEGMRQSAAGWAAECLRYLASVRKEARENDGSQDAQAVEFLYVDVMSDQDSTFYSIRHRVIRKTRRKVFVDHQFEWDTTPEWDSPSVPRGRVDKEGWERYYGQRTIALDREKLEREGSVWSRQARAIFYTTPIEDRQQSWQVPACLQALGLGPKATPALVKAAYRRLAKTAHPDAGGTHEAFVALQEAYEQALALMGGQRAERGSRR